MRYLAVILAVLTSCAAPARIEIQEVPAQPDTTVSVQDVLAFNEAQFRTVVAALAEQCTLNAPVQLMVGHIEEARWGDTSWDEENYRYVIRIDSRQHMHSLLDTLIHEWAHAMVWDSHQREEDDAHGAMWGVAWARAYRAMLSTDSFTGEGDEDEQCRSCRL